MIKIPNYNVIVPVIPDLRLYVKKRTDVAGDRKVNVHTFTAVDTVYEPLPWIPASKEWVEVYIDGVRLINPRIRSAEGGITYYEVFNIENNALRFTSPISGEVRVTCDKTASHWWGSVLLEGQNVQAYYTYKQVYDFVFNKWPVTGGSINGFNYRIFYEPGPEFQANSYVIIDGCRPTSFNGNFKVATSNLGQVTFRGNVAARDSMQKFGSISGFGNAVIKHTEGIALYSEPIIITQPYNGYARLSTDRKSIAYVPRLGYVGNDTFSWAMINQHGQIGDPKCVTITVTAN